MKFRSKLAYCNSVGLWGLGGGIILVMLLDVELPLLFALVALLFDDCLWDLMILVFVGSPLS